MKSTFVRICLIGLCGWPALAQEEIYVQNTASQEIFSVSVTRGIFQPSTGLLAVTSAENGLKVVSLKDWKVLFANAQLPGTLTSIRFVADGQLVTARADGQLNYWDVVRGLMTRSVTAHPRGVVELGVHASGHLLVAGGNNTIHLFNPSEGKTLSSVSLGDERILSMAVHPNGKIAVVGLFGNKLSVHDSALARVSAVTELRESPAVVTFSQDGKMLATGGNDGTVRLFDTNNWQLKGSKNSQRGGIREMSFHPKSLWVAAVSSDSSLEIYDVSSLAVVKHMTLPDAAFTFASFVSDEAMVTGDSRGRVSTWTVLPKAPDTTAPAITILQPTRYSEDSPTKIYATEYDVFGIVYDESEISEVLVGNRKAVLSQPKVENTSARQAGLKGKEFRVTVNLAATGMNLIEVKARDESGNMATQPLYLRRLMAGEAIEVLEPAENAETENVAIEVQFKPWFEVSSYSLSANTIEITDRRGPLRIRPGDAIKEEVPLIVGYNQIGITVNGKKGERFTKLVGVTRKFSAAITEAIRQPRSQASRETLGPQRWAVIVGISEYGNPSIPSLKFADKDADAVAAFLQTPEGGSFDRDHMRVLTNKDATLPNLREAMIDFLQQAIDKDLVLIYFAGHGAPDPTRPQNLYLLTHDTDPTRLGTTAFPMWDIQTVIARQIQAKKVVVLSDACHSGGISVDVATRGLDVTESNPINHYLAELSRAKEGLVVFTASAAGEVSQEFPELGHGAFTYYLLEGLKGAADLNNDHLVTINELMGYVEEQVKRKTRGAQNPTRSQTTYDKELPMSVLNK
ncbi:MAG: caspase family protein [Ignavibacteriales bacterium]|nr:caspase family protein [Ignavibacteriales bacterium]